MKRLKAIPNSLYWRLALASLIWLPIALIVSGFALAEIFAHFASDFYRQSLKHDAEHIIEALEASTPDSLALSRLLPDSRYELRNSGRYWQINVAGLAPLRSPSLSGFELIEKAGDKIGAEGHFVKIDGPDGQTLLAFVQRVEIPASNRRGAVMIASDQRQLEGAVRSFRQALVASLCVLGLGLLIAVFMQIDIGLSPLRKLREAVEALKRGNPTSLNYVWPSELAPLAEDLKSVASRNRQLVDRARSEAQNLAHGLKTPLAVLMNHARENAPFSSVDAQIQLQAMQRYIERHLARVNAGASSLEFRDAVDARRAILRIVETQSQLFPNKSVRSKFFAETLRFPGSDDDLSDIVGNILENAFKWARKNIEIDVFNAPGSLVIHVADDGPGIPEHRVDEVLRRGVRFDDTIPGSGLGLSIANDMIKLYGGQLALDKSKLGGLLVKICLPHK